MNKLCQQKIRSQRLYWKNRAENNPRNCHSVVKNEAKGFYALTCRAKDW